MDGRIRPVRPLIIVPIDPLSQKIGGIRSFVNDFIRFAPPDFEPEIIGCTADPVARPVGRWTGLDIGGRRVPCLPVLATPDVNRRSRLPLSLAFTVAAMARPSAHRFRGRVLQFHHPVPPAGFLAVDAPKILTVHLNAADIDAGGGESRWSRLPGALHRLEDMTLPRMNRVFIVNRAGLDFYRRRHPAVAGRVTFLPTSVDQEHFQILDPHERAEARVALLRAAGLGPLEPGPILLFVGRLEEQKDPLLLMDVVAATRRRVPGARLIVVGDGSLRPAAAARARDLAISDHVHFVGYRGRQDMPDVMNGADVLVLTSRFEGMPIAALEALACGLPVVAPPVGEVPLVIQHELSGYLAGERTPEALADGVRWVLGHPREELAGVVRASVAAFRPQDVLRPYYEAHRALAASRQR